MQSASFGARRIPRHASSMITGTTARSIHIPAFARFTSPTSGGTAKRILSEARNILSRFVGHLTAPGISAHSPASFKQTVQRSAAGRMSSIQERLSFSARHTLSRPSQPLFFPRGPTFTHRSVAQVGFGTARNFSSGRSVFQNLVENVPLASRALYEADWEVRMQKERAAMMKISKGKNVKEERKEMLKPKNVFTYNSNPVPAPESGSDMDHYFATAIGPSVTTCLLVPLAPTPTRRVPLPSDVPDHSTLLPLPTLASIHNSHELHSLRVSALFSRLDAANVWAKGVLCSAYSERGYGEGVCTMLKIEFAGWSIAEVRGVIGESGSGWCALEEIVTKSEQVEDGDAFSDVSSLLSDYSEQSSDSHFAVEPAQSLLLPTLDFSFVSLTSPGHNIISEAESDPWEDSSSEDSWLDHNHFGFSSDFVSRLDTHQWQSSSGVSA
ncbi:hypothetical protein GGU10DRAFT_355242 [Lentinula aff. detonsa]|uniref:Uncharacterized protein n=1 Tax=Lentinula aff. detonsa TaxID=2804958 RepID=A0AA38KA29_9AGAR|nr:hypothetical protein GGU10DRAFT_355242 [Lentinula aff. detonsa]